MKEYTGCIPNEDEMFYYLKDERRIHMKKDFSEITSKFQYVGGAMMIPIILLVVCGFCMGIASPLVNFIFTQGSLPWIIAALFMKTGSMIMSNIPIWFTVGIAFGLSKENKGWAALASLFMLMVVNNTINTLLSLSGITAANCNVEGLVALGKTIDEAKVMVPMFKSVGGIFTYDMSIFVSLVCGGTTGALMNKWGNKKLPEILSFFAGSKFVIFIIPFFGIGIGTALYYIWPFINELIQSLGNFISTSGLLGTFVHRVIDRSLLPFGMHHLINFPLFYSPIGGTMIVDGVQRFGTADISQALVASKDATSFLIRNYGQGKVVVNVAGWCGAMLAMYHTSRKENRKKMLALMIPALFTAAVVGVTEPMEFTVLFANPLLYYLVHVPLAGLAAVICEASQISISGDALVFMLTNFLQPQKVHALALLWIMPLFFGLYYTTFRFAITKFNIMTPGRSEAKEVKFVGRKDIKNKDKNESFKPSENEFAENIVDCFGGADNILSVENCATRLRVKVKDSNLVTNKDFWVSNMQAMGVVENGVNYQIIYGPKVINICSDVKRVLGK